jgi:hypothetical protein
MTSVYSIYIYILSKEWKIFQIIINTAQLLLLEVLDKHVGN